MSTNKPDSLQDLNKTKINTMDKSKVTTNKTRPRSNSTLNKTTKSINGKTTTANARKTAVLSSTNPNSGRPRTTSLGSQSIQNKSKSKIPNTTNAIKNNTINSSKSTSNAVKTTTNSTKSTVNSKLSTKPKASSTIKNTKSKNISSSTSSLKPKASSTLKTKTSTVKPKISSNTNTNTNTAKPKINSSAAPTTSKVKSTSNISSTVKKVKPSTSSTTISKTKVAKTNTSISSTTKPKSSVRVTKTTSSRLNSTTNSRLKPSTASSTTVKTVSTTLKKPSTTSSTIKKPSSSSTFKKTVSSTSTLKKSSVAVKSKSNLSVISTTSSSSKSKSNPTLTTRLTTSPTPYSSQNSVCSTSTTSSTLVRKKKPSPYANVKAKVNSLPSKSSSKASSTSSVATIKPKNSISNSKTNLSLKKSSTLVKNPITPSKSNTVTTIKKESLDKPCLIVTSASIKKDDNEKDKIIENNLKIENKDLNASDDSQEVITSLSKTLQNIAKNEGIKLNNITPMETPVSSSPVVAPCMTTKNTMKAKDKSLPPSPVGTPKLNALNIDIKRENSTNNEILDEYIKNIKFDPAAVEQLDPNTLAFGDDEEDKEAQPSFIADVKHYDEISVSTDDFLDCESSFSDTKSSSLLSPTSPEQKENKLTKTTSMSNLSTISSLSSITHKSSNNSFTSNVSIHTLKSIFDNAVATQPLRSSPIPPSTPVIKKLNPQTLQLFEKQGSTIGSKSSTAVNKSSVIKKGSSTTSSPITSPSLRQTPLMKAVKSRVDSNFNNVCRAHSSTYSKPSVSKNSSSSSISSINKTTLSSNRVKTPTHASSLTKTSSSSSISSINKTTLSTTRTKTPTSTSNITKTSSISSISSIAKHPVSKTSLTKTPTSTGSLKKSSVTRTKTPTLSITSSTDSSSKLSTNKLKSPTHSSDTNKPLTTSSTTVSSKPVHLSPNIPRRNTRVTSLQPEAKIALKSSKTTQLKSSDKLETTSTTPNSMNNDNNDNNVYDDDDEFHDSMDDSFLLNQKILSEPETIEGINNDKRDDGKAIPSYTVKKHTLDQSQICEITEDSFILNQYVEEDNYYQTKHSNHEELIGDLIHADLIIDQIKREAKKKAEEFKLNSEKEKKDELKLEEKEENIERENETETEILNDEDGMSLGSISVKKLLKKNITNIIKPKNFTSLIKKKSNIDMNESFESNTSFSDNNSEVSGISDKGDSKGSTSYVLSMFMQSLNGANNLIKKKRNSDNFDDLKITISGPFQDDEVKTFKYDETKSEADTYSIDTNSLVPKTVVVPLNATIEIPKRVSSAIPFSDDDSSIISNSFKPSKTMLNSPMKLDVSSTIQSTPFKLINKSVEKNRDKHISADSAIYLGDCITYENIKEIINEEWVDTINKQKYGVSNIMEENENEDDSTNKTSIDTSFRAIQNNQILMNITGISYDSFSSTIPCEENNEISEAQATVQKQLKKINNIICEIAYTEKTYVNELAKLLEIYYYPMEQNQVLNDIEMNYLYSNIVNIYQFHSEIFYPKLVLVQKEHEKNIKLITETDVLNSPSSIKMINESISIEAFFKIVSWPFQFLYKPYYINFKKASDFVAILNNSQKQKYSSENVLVQAEELGFGSNCPIFERENKKKFKKLKTFLKNCTERMDHNQVDILGYLILPIQRLPRYLLLLEGLSKSVKLLEEAIAKLAPKESILEKNTDGNLKQGEKGNSFGDKEKKENSKEVINVDSNKNENDKEIKKIDNKDSINETSKDGDSRKDNVKIETKENSKEVIKVDSNKNEDAKEVIKVDSNKNEDAKEVKKVDNKDNINESSKDGDSGKENVKIETKKNDISSSPVNKKNSNTKTLSKINPKSNVNEKKNVSESNKNINKLKENLNNSSNATRNNIEARKATDRTERAKKAQINVKSMIAQIESNNGSKIPTKSGTTRNNTRPGARTNTVTSRVNSNLPKSKTINTGNTSRNGNKNINSSGTQVKMNTNRTNNNINRNKTNTATNSNKNSNSINNNKSMVNKNNTKIIKSKTNISNTPNSKSTSTINVNKKKTTTEINKLSNELKQTNELNKPTTELKQTNELNKSTTELKQTNELNKSTTELKQTNELNKSTTELKQTNELNKSTTELKQTNELNKPVVELKPTNEISKPEIKEIKEESKNINEEEKVNKNNISNKTEIKEIKEESKNTNEEEKTNNDNNISLKKVENKENINENINKKMNANTNTILNEFNNINNNNTMYNKTYTIAMAAEDIKNIIELCNKAISS